MEYLMWYLGICSVLFVFTIYRLKVEVGVVTLGNLLCVIFLTYTPFVNFMFGLHTLNFYGILDKKVF